MISMKDNESKKPLPITSIPTTNDPGELQIRQGAYLPHWEREGALYFVTFRLGDSLPQSVLNSWIAERDTIQKIARLMNRPLNDEEAKRVFELFSEKVEGYIDAGHGACWLQNAAIAKIVQNAFLFFDGKRYLLHAWCIMPNHSHVVVQPLPGTKLERVLHSWKSYTANEANKILNRQGQFWQGEPYDHLIRDEGDYYHCVDYTYSNPERAGLTNWPWRGKRDIGYQPY